VLAVDAVHKLPMIERSWTRLEVAAELYVHMAVAVAIGSWKSRVIYQLIRHLEIDGEETKISINYYPTKCSALSMTDSGTSVQSRKVAKQLNLAARRLDIATSGW
jgi:hypothetical protein